MFGERLHDSNLQRAIVPVAIRIRRLSSVCLEMDRHGYGLRDSNRFAYPQAMKSRSKAPNRSMNFGTLVRTEYPLLIGLASAAFFLWIGNAALDGITQPYVLAGVFAWLFVGVLWSAISVVRHADGLAVKMGEPSGTIILTLSAITIEVIMISAAMLHGANNPTLARDMMFAVVMIALNGLVGLSLLLGGLRHREQHYNLHGTSSYLNTIMALSVLGLVLPNFTTSMSGPRLSSVQQIFLIVTSLILYGIFLLMQTGRNRESFTEAKGGDRSGDHAQDHEFRRTVDRVSRDDVVSLSYRCCGAGGEVRSSLG